MRRSRAGTSARAAARRSGTFAAAKPPHPRKSGTVPRQWAKGAPPSAADVDGSASAAAAASAVGPSPAPPASVSLWTDYWHLESGGVQWRSEVERAQTLLQQLESHLRAPPSAEAQAAKAKAKAQRKKSRQQRRAKRKEKAAAAAAATAAAGTAPGAPLDLTAEPAASSAAADVDASSSEESEEEVDVVSLLNVAHRTAYPSAAVAAAAPPSDARPATSSRGNKSRRGKKRVIRDDDEEDADEQQPQQPPESAEEKQTDAVSLHRAVSADDSGEEHKEEPLSAAAALLLQRSRSDVEGSDVEEPEDAELQNMGATLRGILTSFHSAQRKHAAKLKQREKAAAKRGGRKRAASPHRRRARNEDGHVRTPSPPPKRRRAQKTHRLFLWKEESLGKAAAASAAASIASDSGVGLPIEERLARFPSHFLCLGFLTLRQDGPLDVARVERTPLRIAFAQKLLPSLGTSASAVQAPDPEEPLRCYFRSAEADETTRARQAALAAEKRALARLRRQQESDDEDAIAAGLPRPSRAQPVPSIETEEKTQAAGHMQDEQALSGTIIWHPAAVLGTHHSRRTIRVQNSLQAAAAAAAAASSSTAVAPAPAPSYAPISSATLDALFALFCKQLVYLHPVYSPREAAFTLHAYLMPHAWQRDAAAVPRPVFQMENEAVCAQLRIVVAEWGCQVPPQNKGRNNALGHHHHHHHVSPHALFEACRPPPVGTDESAYPVAAPLTQLLQQRGLRPTLRPYQKQAVAWMMQRERQPWKAVPSKQFRFEAVSPEQLGLAPLVAPPAAAVDDDGPAAMDTEEDGPDGGAAAPASAASAAAISADQQLESECRERLKSEYEASWTVCHPPSIAHPFSSVAVASSSSASAATLLPPESIWLNEFTGAVSARSPGEVETMEEGRGGILADEMGLGKTLCCIALLLASPRRECGYGHSLAHTRPPIGGADMGGALVPILPRTVLPQLEAPGVAGAAAVDALEVSRPIQPAAAAGAAVIPAPRAALPAPPLLVDPLELSKKAYAFYQNQLAVSQAAEERERAQARVAAAAAAAASASSPGDAADSDEGEHEYGSPGAVALPPPRRDINCYCGHDSTFFHSSGERLVECELCHTLQHAICMRVDAEGGGDSAPASAAAPSSSPSFVPNPPFPYSYLCPTCASLSTTPKLPVGATLIVCPEVILAQWAEELGRHVGSGANLRVLVYRGVRSVAMDEGAAVQGGNVSAGADSSVAVSDGGAAKDASAEDDVVFMGSSASSSSASAVPRYSVFVATEDFVSIRVQRPSVEPPSKKPSKRASAAATSSRRASRSSGSSKGADASDDPPASSTPTALPFSLVRPAQFAPWDVILTTYSVLQSDLYHAQSDATHARAARYAKKYRVLPTPLLGVNFWRLVLDEAQMVGEGSTRCAEMALLLSAVQRWSVTGTPVYKSMQGDLYGLLLFLGVLPYSNKAFWQRVVAAPYEAGNPRARARMHALMGRIMWRNSKTSVGTQLGLPPTTTTVTRVHFTPIERYMYDKRRDECKAASAHLRQYGKAALSSVQLRKVMHSLLRLRQACVHPQIGSTHGMVSLTKHTLTLSELSLAMLKDARLTCEEIQRRTYFAMHGLAALAILQRDYEAAIELYTRVVGVDEAELVEEFNSSGKVALKRVKEEEEKTAEAASVPASSSSALVSAAAAGGGRASYTGSTRREIAIDDLQKIHALHNLADALALQHGCRLDDFEPADPPAASAAAPAAAAAAAPAAASSVKDEASVKMEGAGEEEEKNESEAAALADGMADVEADDSAAVSSVAVAAPPTAAALALAAIPPAVHRRIRLLRRFVTDLRGSYLHKQALLVADAQAKFHSANAVLHAAQHPILPGGAKASAAVARHAGSWWLECLSRLSAVPELEERFVHTLRRDLLLANESLVATEKAQSSIAESFRHASGFKFILATLLDELDRARANASKRMSLQTLHQPPLESEIRASSHCARCRSPHQSGPLCVNCKASSMLNDYEKQLYRFRFTAKNQYLAGANQESKALILPGEGRSRKELATLALMQARERTAAASADPGVAAALAAGEEEDEDERRRNNNFQQDSELQQSLRILLKFCTDHAGELEVAERISGGSSSSSLQRTLSHGQDHLHRFDLLKKELKAMLTLNRVHREQLSLYDELAMSSLRIRLRYEGEEVAPAERHFKLQPHEVDQTGLQFESDIAECLANMREWKGRMRFLEVQVQQIVAADAGSVSSSGGAGAGAGGDEVDPSHNVCAICQDTDLTLAAEVAVLPCAHRFCPRCVLFMLRNKHDPSPYAPAPPGAKVSSIKCPTCRLKVAKREIAYVTNKRKQTAGHQLGGAGVSVDSAQAAAATAAAASSSAASASASAPDGAGADPSEPVQPAYPFKGSWSSKIHALLQRVMHILAQDPSCKILVYSEWAESLLVIQQALKANSINFLQIGAGGGRGGGKKKMHQQLALFKSNPLIPLLLLPLTTAASGLNIVEASHLILVEPSLSPGKELQAVGRIVRIGQTRPTFVHRFIVANSVEEKIFAMSAAQREASHRAEHAGRNDDGDEAEEEETEGDVIMGARSRPEDALDAGDFASLLGGDDEEGVEQARPAAAEPSVEEQTAQEESDLQSALRDSEAMALGLPLPSDPNSGPASGAIRVEASESAADSDAAPPSALAPSESSFLGAVRDEEESLTSQHRFWTTAVLFDGARRMNRLQALMTLQRLATLQHAAPAHAPEAAPASPHAATSSAASAQLVPFQGKLLSANIIQQLQQLPVAPAAALAS